MANKNDHMVVAYYVNEAAARSAAEDVKEWDHRNHRVKLGAIAVMTIDRDTGKLHADEVGQRNTKSGALWGTVVGAAVGFLAGGIGAIPGAMMGAAGGAAAGSFSHKDVGMSDEQHKAMVDHLRKGGAALAVMADEFEIEDTLAEMIRGGGRAETFTLPRNAQEVLAMTLAAQSNAAAMLDGDLDEQLSDYRMGMAFGGDTIHDEEGTLVEQPSDDSRMGMAFGADDDDEEDVEVAVVAKEDSSLEGVAAVGIVDAAADVVEDVAPVESAEELQEKADAIIVASIASKAGISLVDAANLLEVGLRRPSDVYAAVATPEGRKEVAQNTGWADDQVLWTAKHLDLMRIKGVGPKYATLLVLTGVDSVPELAQRNAESLAAALSTTNGEEAVVEELPSAKMTADWIGQAKNLPRVLVF